MCYNGRDLLQNINNSSQIIEYKQRLRTNVDTIIDLSIIRESI
jgi:hypothetical protein